MKMRHKLLVEIVLMLMIVSVSIFYYNYKKNQEIVDLQKEIDMVYSSIGSENFDINVIKKELSFDIASGVRVELEDNIEQYLLDVSEYLNDLYNIFNDTKLVDSVNIDNIKDTDNYTNILSYYEESKTKINDIKASLEKINIKDYRNNIENKKMLRKFDKLISELSDSEKSILDAGYYIYSIDTSKEILEFLSNNKNSYEINDDVVFFKKRKIFDNFKLLYDKVDEYYKFNIFDYSLVDDGISPEIKAKNIAITKGTNYDLAKNISCIDEVDEEVQCNISGTFDYNTIGKYPINITASDYNGNQASKNITVTVQEQPVIPKTPYYIEIIRNQNTVVVYALDDNDEYSKIVQTFACSTGTRNRTPVGTFYTSKGYQWGALMGGVYGQYSTRIVGQILFHSVPYYSKNKNDLEYKEYNKLGSYASAGCVRLCVRDVKWIYDNIQSGTPVKIYDGELPRGVVKPTPIKIDENDPRRGWDPTDPDPNNPWNTEE